MDQIKNKKIDKEFIKKLINVDKITDNQRDLFQEAFIHSSVIERYGSDNVYKIMGTGNDYECWEFLGDRVMELVSGEYLHDQTRGERKFKTPEGVQFNDNSPNFLTRAKSRMVKKESFASYANECGFGSYICVVSKESLFEDDDEDYYDITYQKRNIHSKSIMEDVFEAFIGVCYHCFEYHVTRDFAQRIIIKYADWDKIMFDNNFKDKILRFYTSIDWGHPEYAELSKEESEPDKWVFTACVLSPKRIDDFSLKLKRVYQFQSTDTNSRKRIWIMENSKKIPKNFIPTGSSGYIAGIGKGRKLKDAEQVAAMNAMINFQSILDF